MITPENINLDTLTHEEAAEILKGMQESVLFLFNALDTDGDGQLSPAEIDAAPDVLRSLDKDGDGELNETELEGYGYHFTPGRVRFNGIVRMLDLEGDLRVTAEDIADAPNRIRRLDKDRDGIVRLDDAIAKRNTTVAQRSGGPADVVRMMMNLAYYTEDGHPVHVWHNAHETPEATSADLHTSGLLMRTVAVEEITDVHDWFPVGAHGTVQLVDWDGTVVWQYTRCARGRHCLHHGSHVMPNGNILVICYEALTPNEAIALGWEPQEFLNPRGDEYVWTERILELEPNLEDGSTKVVWEWAVVDHIVQAYDATKPNYGKVSENLVNSITSTAWPTTRSGIRSSSHRPTFLSCGSSIIVALLKRPGVLKAISSSAGAIQRPTAMTRIPHSAIRIKFSTGNMIFNGSMIACRIRATLF